MQPKISVIVPVYKAEKYLHRCVDSILAQTFTDFELILVNDGSPDNSGAICDEYAKKDSRVRVFHKENGGVSSARNLGLDNAKGEWITFIDSDDYIEEGFLTIPDSCKEDLLIQNCKMYGAENKIIEFAGTVITKQQKQDFINNNIVAPWLKTPWAKFFKREIIQNNNITFPLGIHIGEDTLFVLEYLYHIQSVRFLNSSYYVYLIENYHNKYILTVEEALTFFKAFIQKYNKLKASSIPFLKFTFMFYWSLIIPKDYSSVKKWREDKLVKDVYCKIHKEFKLQWRIKYRFYILFVLVKRIIKTLTCKQ